MAPKNNKRRMRKKQFKQKNKTSDNNDLHHIQSEILTEETTMNPFFDMFGFGMFGPSFFTNESPSYSDYRSDSSTVDIKPFVKKRDELKLTDLELVEKIISMVKCDENSVSILQKLLDVCNDPDKGKMDNLVVLTGCAQLLQDVGEKECKKGLKFISKTFSDRFLPKELVKYMNSPLKIKKQALFAEGGFGFLFIGSLEENTGSATNVVIKESKKEKEQFLKSEAIILSQIDHKNIVKMLSFNPEPMQIVMEFMENLSLDDVLEERNVPLEKFHAMMIDIISGMEYLEKNQIVHRDLAIRNIFVNSELECKIGDFGMAVKITRPDGIYKQKDGSIRGYHIPPSDIISQEFSVKSDIYAFGVLLWEMHCIRQQGSVVRKILLRDFVLLRMLPIRGICPPLLSSYIHNDLFNIDPSQRPSCTEIKNFISAFKGI